MSRVFRTEADKDAYHDAIVDQLYGRRPDGTVGNPAAVQAGYVHAGPPVELPEARLTVAHVCNGGHLCTCRIGGACEAPRQGTPAWREVVERPFREASRPGIEECW